MLRHCGTGIDTTETVIQAEPHHVSFEIGALCDQLVHVRGLHLRRCRAIKIEMKIFGFHAPIVADCVFNAAARRIAEPPCAKAGRLRELIAAEFVDHPYRKIVIIFRHGRAAGEINQPITIGPANTGTQRRHPIGIVVSAHHRRVVITGKRERTCGLENSSADIRCHPRCRRANDRIANCSQPARRRRNQRGHRPGGRPR